jgi:hypothetical protein
VQPKIRALVDGFAMVSEWQAECFCQVFGLDPTRIGILRNAVGPAFADLFGGGPILAAKVGPPTLCYTSTPVPRAGPPAGCVRPHLVRGARCAP